MSPSQEGGLSHSRLMDGVYRRQRHIYDATRKYYLLGRDRLIAELDARPGARVMEIGCGTGRNLVLAARRYPEARFYGIDISDEMLATARGNIERAGLSGRIMLARADAADFSAERLFEVSTFERVYISYAVSMIPDWTGALASAVRIVCPGGRLSVVDFGQQERLPRLARTLLQNWLRRFHVTPRADLGDVVRRLARNTGAEADVRPLYRGYAWLVTVRLPKG